MGVELIGLEKALARFNKAREEAENPADFQEQVAFIVLVDTRNAIESGSITPALEAKTVHRKGGDSRPLYRSGDYAKGFKPEFSAGQIGFKSKFYGKFHQFGVGGMKKRIVGISEQAQKLIVEAGRKAFGWK